MKRLPREPEPYLPSTVAEVNAIVARFLPDYRPGVYFVRDTDFAVLVRAARAGVERNNNSESEAA